MAGRQRPHKQKAIEAFQVYGECSSRCLGTGVSWLTLAERGAQAAGGRVNAGRRRGKQNDKTRKGVDGDNWTQAQGEGGVQCGGGCAWVLQWAEGGGGGGEEWWWCGGLAIGVRNEERISLLGEAG